MAKQAGTQASSDSPFERQIASGYASLKFQDRLEKLFRQRHARNITGLLRGSLVLGLLFIGAQAALDYQFAIAGYRAWSLGITAAALVPLIIIALFLTLRPNRPALLAGASMLVALGVGAGFLALEFTATQLEAGSRFAGFLVIIFYIYFLLGLLFWQALTAGLILGLAFLVSGFVSGSHGVQFAYQGLLLGFSNIVGLLGLYTLEHARRAAFLREGALDFRAGHDGLTGLQNRDAFDKKFDIAWRVARREKRAMSVMMIDIDYFKDYNDQYGHQAGDKCLQGVARVLQPVARRPLDFVGRYGGEEFVIFLTGSVEQYAIEAAERVRAQVEALGIPHSRSKAARVVTVSVGLAHLEPGEASRSKEGLLQMADEALYRAKDQGRNRVLVAKGEEKNITTGYFRQEIGAG